MNREKAAGGERRAAASWMTRLYLLDRWEDGVRRTRSKGGVEVEKKEAKGVRDGRMKKERRKWSHHMLGSTDKMADSCCPPSSVVGRPEFRPQTSGSEHNSEPY